MIAEFHDLLENLLLLCKADDIPTREYRYKSVTELLVYKTEANLGNRSYFSKQLVGHSLSRATAITFKSHGGTVPEPA